VATRRQRINFADVTVVGHFNPAILRHDFLTTTCGLNLDTPISGTPPELPVISEIQYPNIRWFADFNRMVVEERELEEFASFRGPELVTGYLTVLQYTPVHAIGINLNADFVVDNFAAIIRRLLDLDKVGELVSGLTKGPLELSGTYLRSEKELRPKEVTVAFQDDQMDQVRLRIMPQGTLDVLRAHINLERGNLRARLDEAKQFLQKSEHAGSLFQRMIEAITEEAE
jgi:hypothetical protein